MKSRENVREGPLVDVAVDSSKSQDLEPLTPLVASL